MSRNLFVGIACDPYPSLYHHVSGRIAAEGYGGQGSVSGGNGEGRSGGFYRPGANYHRSLSVL